LYYNKTAVFQINGIRFESVDNIQIIIEMLVISLRWYYFWISLFWFNISATKLTDSFMQSYSTSWFVYFL